MLNFIFFRTEKLKMKKSVMELILQKSIKMISFRNQSGCDYGRTFWKVLSWKFGKFECWKV